MSVHNISPDAVAAYWRQFDLESLQRELDETAGELATRQDESEMSRKKLVDLSKDFKKQAGDDARKVATPLLKSFQGEVDSLSKRAKAAEAAFLGLYKRIIESPDPVPALDAAVQWQKKCQKGHDMELECQNLRDTLQQYNAEFAEIKNQEVTIRQLKEKLKFYEEDMEKTVNDQVQERESAVQKRYEDRERQLHEAGSILSLKLQDAERRSEALQTSLNSAQQELFTMRAHSDDSKDAKNSEMEMLSVDLDRATTRAEAADREIDLLKEQLKIMAETSTETEGGQHTDESELRAQVKALEVELTAKDKQIHHLLAELKQANTTVNSQKKSLQKEKDALVADINSKSESLKQMESKLTDQADYDELKKELKVMKSIEFGENEIKEGGSKPLEVLLLEKNKSLQGELTSLKLSKQTLEGGVGRVGTSGDGPKCVPDESKSIASPKPAPSNSQQCNPLQTMVESVGAIVGNELVRQYITEHKIKRRKIRKEKEDALESVEVEEEKEQVEVEEEIPAEESSPIQPAPLTLPTQPNLLSDEEEEITTVLRTHDLFDMEQAVIEGMSRTEAESIATEQLQSIVSDNLKSLGDTSLHTTQVAAHCRQLLAMYNLGQRLFAKTVLNQSQGSLSELLSKPRPWLRLTDRGREAFKKIYAWACDERAVALLRSLSPKKPHASAGRIERNIDNSATTEQRVADILNQVVKAKAKEQQTSQIKVDTDLDKCETPACSNSSEFGMESLAEVCGSSSSRQSRMSSNNRWRHDDIPKEMIFEIYKREMSKLKEQEASLQQQLNKNRPIRSKDRTCSPPSRNSSVLSAESYADPNAHLDASNLQYLQSGTSIRNLRTILPPITQDQLEKCSMIDTEALVARVKSFLSVHSISQRLFGEAVLGLSQGSVSDLLARPKSWNMLTQKGREPFIRMQGFLDDEQAVHNLRLRRDLLNTPVNVPNSEVINKNPMPDPPPSISQASPRSSRSGTSVDSLAQQLGNAVAGRLKLANRQSKSVNTMSDGPLDTQEIVDQVRALLHEHNIGQKLFGEAVLGMSQGTVSELLSKPKPWNCLSLRGREPYSRMQIWLKDGQRVDKLQQYQHFNNINRSDVFKSSKRSLEDSNSNCPSPSPSPLPPMFGPPSVKKSRSLISASQKMSLRSAYIRDAYPSSQTIDNLARSLGLGVRTVINWFHNQRMRAKGGDSNKMDEGDNPSSPQPQLQDSDAGISWRNELMQLISTLSGAEEGSTSAVSPSENGHLENGVSGIQVKTEIDDQSEIDMYVYEKKNKNPLTRQALVDKLEKGLRSADMDWNCGVREEALAALQRQCQDTNDKTAWEF